MRKVDRPIKLQVIPGPHPGRQDPEIVIDLDDEATHDYFDHGVGPETAVCIRVYRGGKRVSAFVSIKPTVKGTGIHFAFTVVNSGADITRKAIGHPWVARNDPGGGRAP